MSARFWFWAITNIVMAMGLGVLAFAQQQTLDRPELRQEQTGPEKPTAGVASPPAGGRPKIVLSAESWDFGTVWYGDPATFALKITNEGDGELKLLKVQASCGCTAAQPERTVLAPGESTEVNIEFRTKNKQGDIHTSVQIETNDPEREQVRFAVNGKVKKLIDMVPVGSVLIRSTDSDAVEPATVRIEKNAEYPEPLKPQVSQYDAAKFGVELKEITADESYELVITSKSPLRRTPTADTIVVTTGIERMPELKIPVSASLVPRVRVSPVAVYVDKRTKEPSTRFVRIEYFGDDPQFKVTGMSCQDERIKAELKDVARLPQPPPTTWSSRETRPSIAESWVVNLPPGTELPAEGVEIQVSTSDPEFDKLAVWVTSDLASYRQRSVQFESYAAGRGPEPATRPARPATRPARLPTTRRAEP